MFNRFADRIATLVVAELKRQADIVPRRHRLHSRHPDKLAVDLCRSLGLDPYDVSELKLELHVGALPNLTVKHYAWDVNAEAFNVVFKDYTLQPKAD